MTRALKMFALAAALCFGAVFNAVAQSDWTGNPSANDAAASEKPAAAPAAEPESAESPAPAVSGQPTEAELLQLLRDDPPPPPTPEPEPESEPPAFAAFAPPPPPPPPPPPRENRAPANSEVLSVGYRAAFGVSAFAGHKVIAAPDFPITVDGRERAIQLGTSHSGSIGFAFAYNVSELIHVVADLQYSLYTARGQLLQVLTGVLDDYRELHEAGVELHAVELPVLARFNFGPVYTEAGLQVGGNLYGKVYLDGLAKDPYMNDVAFGPVVGFGVRSGRGRALLGIRGYYNLIEYAEFVGGNNWTVQAGFTMYTVGF